MNLILSRKSILSGLAVFLFGFLFLIFLENWFRPYAFDHLYYFRLYPSSETMMQTVSIVDLRDAPLESLWNIHIQPPMFDVIRAILARVWTVINPSYASDSRSMDLLHQVDASLYVLWAILYGWLGMIIFYWLGEIIKSTWFAIASAILLLFHPATIFYATLLDGTFLSAVLITTLFYLLWKQKSDPNRSITPLIFIVLALFFTRSIFQWQFILMLAISLLIFKVPSKSIFIFMLITSIVIFSYLTKQYMQFGIFSTTSFTGYNLTKSVDMKISQTYWSKLPPPQDTSGPDTVLTRERKLNGVRNFNNLFYLGLNTKLTASYKKYIQSANLYTLIKNYLDNLQIYLLPSSQFGKHEIVDRLPWRRVYDSIFSHPILPGLLILAGIYWLRSSSFQNGLFAVAYLLPIAYIFLTCVLLEKGENARFKYFLEPTLFIFLAVQFYSFIEQLSFKLIRHS